jgi:ferritin-like metal-binding protein YciE
MKTKDELIDWLRDAYAMEKAMEVALKKQIGNEKLPMDAREQASIHYTETEGHAEAVHACLHKLGADVSTLKSAIAQSMEIVKSVGTMFARDEHIKDVLAAYASEHFEIACYTALSTAAKEAGVPEIVEVCENILKEERKMANWLEANLPAVISAYLNDQAS